MCKHVFWTRIKKTASFLCTLLQFILFDDDDDRDDHGVVWYASAVLFFRLNFMSLLFPLLIFPFSFHFMDY